VTARDRLNRTAGPLLARYQALRARKATVPAAPAFPRDFSDEDIREHEAVAEYTMTSPERVWALRSAVRHVCLAGIGGAIVECGVWKGGGMMAVARTLLAAGDKKRDLYLFDTFEGMSEPTDEDVMDNGQSAAELLAGREITQRLWGYAPMDEVRRNVLGVGYPAERVHFVQGKVEDTLPAAAPDRIALLRLDTDWYESTAHELETLYPRLATGGVLIIDDYGHWKGARKAVDEYFAANRIRLLLNRIDYTARIAIKP
jgi:O-methyltransferase